MRQMHARAGRHRWADFIRLPEDDRRELIDGRLVEIEMPTALHEWICAYLSSFLVGWVLKHGGRVLGSSYKLKLSEKRGLMPDLQLLAEADYEPSSTGLVRGHPRLVVEVISPSSRAYDRLTKMEWYASLKVPEYWVIDSDAQRLERYVLRDGIYAIEEIASGREVFQPKSFRGLKVPLAPMWAPPK